MSVRLPSSSAPVKLSLKLLNYLKKKSSQYEVIFPLSLCPAFRPSVSLPAFTFDTVEEKKILASISSSYILVWLKLRR